MNILSTHSIPYHNFIKAERINKLRHTNAMALTSQIFSYPFSIFVTDGKISVMLRAVDMKVHSN